MAKLNPYLLDSVEPQPIYAFDTSVSIQIVVKLSLESPAHCETAKRLAEQLISMVGNDITICHIDTVAPCEIKAGRGEPARVKAKNDGRSNRAIHEAQVLVPGLIKLLDDMDLPFGGLNRQPSAEEIYEAVKALVGAYRRTGSATTFTEEQRDEIAKVLQSIDSDGMDGPRDLDCALDAIESTIFDRPLSNDELKMKANALGSVTHDIQKREREELHGTKSDVIRRAKKVLRDHGRATGSEPMPHETVVDADGAVPLRHPDGTDIGTIENVRIEGDKMVADATMSKDDWDRMEEALKDPSDAPPYVMVADWAKDNTTSHGKLWVPGMDYSASIAHMPITPVEFSRPSDELLAATDDSELVWHRTDADEPSYRFYVSESLQKAIDGNPFDPDPLNDDGTATQKAMANLLDDPEELPRYHGESIDWVDFALDMLPGDITHRLQYLNPAEQPFVADPFDFDAMLVFCVLHKPAVAVDYRRADFSPLFNAPLIPGINAPPLPTNCRSVATAYELGWKERGDRVKDDLDKMVDTIDEPNNPPSHADCTICFTPYESLDVGDDEGAWEPDLTLVAVLLICAALVGAFISLFLSAIGLTL